MGVFDLEDFFGGGVSVVGGSLDSFDFDDDFFGLGASGGDAVVFEDVGFEGGGGVAFGGVVFGGAFCGGATFGVASFVGAFFDDFFFESAAAVCVASFPPVFLGGATAGWASGARSIRDATGALVVGGAVNCPSAIWRARSLTLRNMSTWFDGAEEQSTRTTNRRI